MSKEKKPKTECDKPSASAYISVGRKSTDGKSYLETLVEAERAEMQSIADEGRGTPPAGGTSLVGLALSGGGVRSATFGLGILQSFSRGGWLDHFDYVSTVSGGGYIGGALSWFLKHGYGTTEALFPFETEAGLGLGVQESDGSTRANVDHLRWLRQHGNYLTPGNGHSFFAGLSVVLRGAVVSLLIYGAFLIGALALILSLPQINEFIPSWKPLYNVELLWITPVLLAATMTVFGVGSLMMTSVVHAWNPGSLFAYGSRRRAERIGGYSLVAIGVSLVLGTLPLVDRWLASFVRGMRHIGLPLADPGPQVDGAFAGIALVAVALGIVVAMVIFARTARGAGSPASWVAPAAAVLVSYGLLVSAYWGAVRLEAWESFSPVVGFIVIGGSLLVARITNVNLASVHRFYRDRLMETFLPNIPVVKAGADAMPDLPKDSDRSEGAATAAVDGPLYCFGRRRPYHLINTNVVVPSAEDLRARGRGGDSFLLSALYCGSQVTGWIPTKDYMGGRRISLASALAISGAAAHPHAGVGGLGPTRTGALSFLMKLLNLRLGTWVQNPGPFSRHRRSRFPNYINPGLPALLGLTGRSETTDWVELSDGGHFENLGLYELVRRRCKLIIACDAGADPGYRFADLGNAIRRVRVDFGALIDFEPGALRRLVPAPAEHQTNDERHRPTYAERNFLVARITYPGDSSTGATASEGVLIYIKTTPTAKDTADVYAYQAANPGFPDESTLDQFFDENQFEAYRQLGFRAGYWLLEYLKDPRAQHPVDPLDPTGAKAVVFTAFERGLVASALATVSQNEQLRDGT